MEWVVAGVWVLISAVGLVKYRFRRRDEMFEGITPGLFPAPGQPTRRVRVRREHRAVTAVRFEPPAGIGPGLTGVIVDGRVDPVELSATLLDLGNRGWLKLRPLANRPGTKPDEWLIERCDPMPEETLSPTEELLYRALFTQQPAITLTAFKSSQSAALAEAPNSLQREASARQWFSFHSPGHRWLSRTAGPMAVAFGIIGLIAGISPILGVGLIIAGVIWIFGTAGIQTTLTAEGYAMRVQALGFKQYLATAEADQLKFEAGIDVFSRYLPYAMVFGVVDHWRNVFADAVARGLIDDSMVGLNWLDLGDALSALQLLDFLTLDGGIFDGLTTDFAGLVDLPGVDGVFDSVGDLLGGLGDIDIDL